MSDLQGLPFEDSRRLTGPNLWFGSCGASLEALLPGAHREQARLRWMSLVRALCQRLGWVDGPLCARVHAKGATLAFAAPEDQLFTATELNEWAWQQALEETQAQPAAAPWPRLYAPGHPVVGDERSAAATLLALAVAEARPELMALLQEARLRHLPAYLDEDLLSLGAGCGHEAWPVDALPSLVEVPWERLHGIPTALVTGSNGKTTTTRLLAAMVAAQGLSAGYTCTDGICIQGELLETGDFSGPMGARAVLRDRRVEVAILETARGGLLRRGLAVAQAEVAVVTNVSADHFGEYGVHTLEDLTAVKLVVAQAVTEGGLLVLNADDDQLAAMGPLQTGALGWFSLKDDHPLLLGHRRLGGATCGLREGHLHLFWQGEHHELGEVAAMPLSMEGRAAYNVSNLAGAALAARALGVPPPVIANVLRSFGSAPGDNPGRLEAWAVGGIRVYLDYAHNPEGLQGLLDVAVGGGRPARLGLLLGQAGNREDVAIRELAATAARQAPDLVILKDMDGYLRGREPGEVPDILRAELIGCGLPGEHLRTILSEEAAVLALLEWARPGDLLVLPVHGSRAKETTRSWLDQLAAEGWRAGDPVAFIPGTDEAG